MIDATARIHPQALVDAGAQIGARTRVWAFAHVLPGAILGDDCNLCDHTFVEGGARVGDRVTVKCGVYLWDGVTVEDDVFIGPAAVFTNDRRPRSKRYPAAFPATLLCRGVSVGGGAVILPGLRLGAWAMIGAGAVVTRDVASAGFVAAASASPRLKTARARARAASPTRSRRPLPAASPCTRSTHEHRRHRAPRSAQLLR